MYLPLCRKLVIGPGHPHQNTTYTNTESDTNFTRVLQKYCFHVWLMCTTTSPDVRSSHSTPQESMPRMCGSLPERGEHCGYQRLAVCGSTHSWYLLLICLLHESAENKNSWASFSVTSADAPIHTERCRLASRMDGMATQNAYTQQSHPCLMCTSS